MQPKPTFPTDYIWPYFGSEARYLDYNGSVWYGFPHDVSRDYKGNREEAWEDASEHANDIRAQDKTAYVINETRPADEFNGKRECFRVWYKLTGESHEQ